MMSKKLVICGAGIKSLSHHTKEFNTVVENADKVLYLVNEPLLEQWLKLNSKKSYSLSEIYFSSEQRYLSYQMIANKIISTFDSENNVCLVLYGHPLFLADPINLVINKAKSIGIYVKILPGISSFDCLLADLEIRLDSGCFFVEASYLVNNKIKIDVANHVILWQAGVIDINSPPTDEKKSNINKLKNELLKYYHKDSELFLYEASIYPHIKPLIVKTRVNCLIEHNISSITTVYLPPVKSSS